jgi:hypothetical protein
MRGDPVLCRVAPEEEMRRLQMRLEREAAVISPKPGNLSLSGRACAEPPL